MSYMWYKAEQTFKYFMKQEAHYILLCCGSVARKCWSWI